MYPFDLQLTNFIFLTWQEKIDGGIPRITRGNSGKTNVSHLFFEKFTLLTWFETIITVSPSLHFRNKWNNQEISTAASESNNIGKVNEVINLFLYLNLTWNEVCYNPTLPIVLPQKWNKQDITAEDKVSL